MKLEKDFYRINNTNLWFNLIFSGNGQYRPTLVFLHDALGSVEGWKDFPEKLCDQLQLNGLVFDRKGHGRSEDFEGSYDVDYMKRQAEEVLPEVLNRFNIHNPVFIGHSDGGTIALLYEAAFQHSIALVSIAAHMKVEDITRQGIREAVQFFNGDGVMERLEKYHDGKGEQLVRNWEEIWLSEEFGKWNIGKDLESISCPCLIIQGSSDEYATIGHAEEIGRSIGDSAEVVLLDGLKHFPQREDPEKVIKEINRFITKMILPP